MTLPTSVSSSQQEQLSARSGITQTFGGIDKTVVGINPTHVILGVVALGLIWALSQRGKK